MSLRAARHLAWSSCAAAAALIAFAYLLPALGASPGSDRLFESIFTLMILTYATVGAVVATRRPENAIGWIFSAFALCAALLAAAAEYAEFDPVGPSVSLPAYAIAAWIAEWIALPTFGLIVFVLLLFPTGRALSSRWRGGSWFAAAAFTAAALCAAFKPGRLGETSREADNPLAVGGVGGEALEAAAPAAEALAVAALIVGATAMVLRFRRSRGDERLQLKWLACAGGLGASGLAVSILGDTAGVSLEPLFYASFLALALLPVAAGVAILRYRLYEIDRVINRALVYGALTATLAAGYLACVLVFQLVLSPLTDDLATAASTLAVAALFRPARARIQAAVDRRFYRRRYDAARTLEAFGGRLRDELDLEALGADLRGVVRDTVQPTHVSLWLRGDAR